MKFIDGCVALFLESLRLLSYESWDHDASQTPIGNIMLPDQHHQPQDPLKGPIFSPPHGPDDFFCDYSAMGRQWKSCSTPDERDCWLTDGHDKFDIKTDYEAVAPKGVLRRYTLDIDSFTLHGDGFKNPDGKVFNQSYPGPWIMACWGDELEITVTNHLDTNGSTIHWHGIRQLHTSEMDGVNGVTQCPIATNDSYTYRFRALQYGTSWYHSHYALQYADGLLGPLTIFGPSSANYDEAIEPTLMADNLHQSAFSLFFEEIDAGHPPPQMVNILLNGTGLSNCTAAELKSGICVTQDSRYNVTMTKGKKYLMRLINTSVDTDFVFTIDNHNVTVVETDFVPINPYSTNSVLIGIGQRYHIIVDAEPIDASPGTSAFWMRTIPSTGCSNFVNSTLDFRRGILYYASSSSDYSLSPSLTVSSSNTVLPTTTQNANVSIVCADEPYHSLVPVVPWEVPEPSVPQPHNNNPILSSFEVGLEGPPTVGPLPPPGNFSHWQLGHQPLWINFSDPTIRHVDERFNFTAQENHVVIPVNVPADDWVYMLISAVNLTSANPPPGLVTLPVSHPIHLHGHDFALLAQSTQAPPTTLSGLLGNLTLSNPPRRDVALLPAGGYIVIAFRADNPGVWLVHCHIAWHASSGLAMQILERDGDIQVANKGLVDDTCRNWDKWVATRGGDGKVQDDSGI